MSEHAIVVHEPGGPEALSYEEVDVPEPGPGEVRIRHTAIGVNYRDVYDRSGLYPHPLPVVIGAEAAAIVEAVGPGVPDVTPGDRVAYCLDPMGAYATARVYPADRLVALPNGLGDEEAAMLMLKGLTVWYLFRRLRPLEPGETILFHAAAGGVGLIACQWARHLGVRLIGTAGSKEKAELALSHGAADVIRYREQDVAERLKELTGGEGVPVVYDSVGKDTWRSSLECLRPRGLMVLFGSSSGAVTSIDPGELMSRGSLFLTRPTLRHYVSTPAELREASADLFDLVSSGAIGPNVGQRFPLRQAAEAHRALEARATIGSTVLIP